MTFVKMTCEVNVDLSDIPSDAIAKEVHLRDEVMSDLKEHFREEIEEDVTLEKFTDEDIAVELKRRKVEGVGHSIRRIYEAIADGRTRDALDEMHAAFDEEGLAPPSTQLALSELLSGRKGSSNVRN